MRSIDNSTAELHAMVEGMRNKAIQAVATLNRVWSSSLPPHTFERNRVFLNSVNGKQYSWRLTSTIPESQDAFTSVQTFQLDVRSLDAKEEPFIVVMGKKAAIDSVTLYHNNDVNPKKTLRASQGTFEDQLIGNASLTDFLLGLSDLRLSADKIS